MNLEQDNAKVIPLRFVFEDQTPAGVPPSFLACFPVLGWWSVGLLSVCVVRTYVFTCIISYETPRPRSQAHGRRRERRSICTYLDRSWTRGNHGSSSCQVSVIYTSVGVARRGAGRSAFRSETDTDIG